MRRCYNKRDKGYPDYGGRGITVCKKWRHNFPSFLRDMGLKPSPNLSLGRIDNDKGYFPKNCRWETAHQQQMNRRAPKRKGQTAVT
jgi:hypothetical protein